MILEYTCSNFKSIKDMIIFSMLATTDTSYEENLVKITNNKVNRITAIYGSNGSGKSCFINSISLLKNIICNSNNFQPGDMIPYMPHKLSEKPASHTIQFIKGSTRYAYGIEYDSSKIYNEYLYYFPNGKQSKIFDRTLDGITFGEKFKKDLDKIKSFIKPNKSFLAIAANLTNVNDIIQVFMFFKDDLIIYPEEHNDWLFYSIDKINKDNEIKKIFIEFMQSIGYEIQDIHTKVEQANISEEAFIQNMPEIVRKQFANLNPIKMEAKLDYGKFIVDLAEESNGMKKLFEVICPILDIIFNNKILLWDEMETKFHPYIVDAILNLFMNSKKDSMSQLIFSTHDTNLLDLNRFRRDQIWFTELTTDRATDLYSLSELKNVRKDENIRKGYMNGKYGAIPFLQNPLIFPITEEVDG